MASKKAAESSEVIVPKENSFDFDRSIDATLKELELSAVNIQRDSFIANSVSSGFLVTDLILGGGYPGGRFVIYVGPEGCGKSTFSFYAMRNAINLNTYVIHFDYEGATDPTYVARIGLKINWLKEKKDKKPILYRNVPPDTGEQAFTFMHRILKQLPDASPGSGIPIMFVLDSLHAMLPEIEDENDDGKGMALAARMFSKELKKVKSACAKKNCILFATNQLREKPGPSWGSPFYEPGGNGPKQYSDVRIMMFSRAAPKLWGWKGKVLPEPSWDNIGNDRYTFSHLSTVKNKMNSPFRDAWCRFWFEEKGSPGPGVDPVFDTFEYLRMTGQLDVLKSQKLAVLMQGPACSGQTLSWQEFKNLILDPEQQKIKETYLPNLCRVQLESGEGFKKYYDTLGGISSPTGNKEVGEDDSIEEADVD